MQMKGISPLIATILLIAFTIAVAGIFSIWLMSFTKTSTETVGEEATTQLICSYGGIAISDLNFCSANNYLTGKVENTRTIALGNITIQILYTNASSQKIHLNISLVPREKHTFNVSASSGYDTIRVMTNCSSVYDEVSASSVTTSC